MNLQINYKKHIPIILCILAVLLFALILKIDWLIGVILLCMIVFWLAGLWRKMSRTGQDSRWRLMDYSDDAFEKLSFFYPIAIFIGFMVLRFIVWYVGQWKGVSWKW